LERFVGSRTMTAMSRLDHVPCAMEDEKPFIVETPQDTEDSDNEQIPQCMWKRRAATVLGLLALTACACLALTSFGQPVARDEPPALISASQLFHSRELAEVATDNVMKIGRGEISPDQRDDVLAHVTARFRNISTEIASRHPEVPAQLDAIQLDAQQQKAILDDMRGLSDPRLQALGRDVGLVLHAGLAASREPSSALDALLQEHFSPRIGALRQLRDEVTPAELREDEEDGGEGPGLALDPERMSLVQTIHKWNVEIDFSRPELGQEASSVRGRRLKSSMMAGLKMMEHAQKFFKTIQKFAKKAGITLPDLKDILDKVNVGKLCKCALSAVSKGKMMSVMKCGMQFASAAMDVLKSIKSGKPLKKSN